MKRHLPSSKRFWIHPLMVVSYVSPNYGPTCILKLRNHQDLELDFSLNIVKHKKSEPLVFGSVVELRSRVDLC